MMPLAPLIGVQDNASCSKNAALMPVVDPVTRKLLIPHEAVTATRAQQRATIPSLCQLYLQGRCRQGSNCHQVHADIKVVQALRSQVGRLPNCCAEHGDDDYAGVLNEHSCLSNVFLHVPESTYEKGYIPLRHVGYTIPVSKLINELPQELYTALDQYRQKVLSGSIPDELPPRVVLETADIPICRLHVTDRCRYAEECSFLHICKEIAKQDPPLPLGRRSRSKVLHKPLSNMSPDSQRPHTVSAMVHAATPYTPAPHLRPPTSVRGFPLMRRPSSGPGHMNSHYAFGVDSASGSAGPTSYSLSRDVRVSKEIHGVSHDHSFCTPRDGITFADFEMSKKSSAVRSHRISLSPALWEPAADPIVVDSTLKPQPHKGAVFHSPMSIRASCSDSIGLHSRDEGSTSFLNFSYSRSSGKIWCHDPYNFQPLELVKGN